MLGIQQIINILFRKRKEFVGKCELLMPPNLVLLILNPALLTLNPALLKLNPALVEGN